MDVRTTDQDWRLRLDLQDERLAELVRTQLRRALDEHVVITSDGVRVFAYAMTEQALARARALIARVLRSDGLGPLDPAISRWDESARRWRQTAPATGAAEALDADIEAAAGRAVACVVGRVARRPFERQVQAAAAERGVRCDVLEHPHLLATQVVFDVSGAPDAVRSFSYYMRSVTAVCTHVDPGLDPDGRA